MLSAVVVGLAAGCSAPIEKVWQYQSYSASGSSPAVGKDLIVFGTANGEVHAVSKAGGFRWKYQTRKEVVSAPQIFGDLIFFGSTNHNLYAIDHSGRKIWSYTTHKRIKGDPLVAGGVIFFGSYDKHLYALEAENRNVRWIFPREGPPAVKDPPADRATNGTAETGAEAATPPEPTIDTSQWPADAFSYPQPTLTSNGLIVVGNLDGFLYAVEKDTGKLKWRWATEGAKSGKGITSTVVERDGLLYFGANDGNIYALNLKTQKLAWKFATGDEVNSSAVIDSSGTLFIGGSDNKLYALDAKTGKKRWEPFATTGPVRSHPQVYKNLVLFGAGQGDGHVYALDTATGHLFWKFETKGAVDADPVIDGNRFYIASADKSLYAFQINKTTN